jgi:hypothetical protein
VRLFSCVRFLFPFKAFYLLEIECCSPAVYYVRAFFWLKRRNASVAEEELERLGK